MHAVLEHPLHAPVLVHLVLPEGILPPTVGGPDAVCPANLAHHHEGKDGDHQVGDGRQHPANDICPPGEGGVPRILVKSLEIVEIIEE